MPPNGTIDPFETVTVSLCVQNVGDANTTNLVGTLQATGGVINPSGPQNYGALVAGGAAVCRNYTFTASGNCGGTLTASLQFTDGLTDLGTVTYNFTLGRQIAPGVFDCCSSTDCLGLICPVDVVTDAAHGSCARIVNFSPPTTIGDQCGAISCVPPSGSAFPVGSTVVTCTAQAGPICEFLVTVNDTEPPTGTCPAAGSITAVANDDCEALVPDITNDVSVLVNCNQAVVIAQIPPPGTTVGLGVTPITVILQDLLNGLIATCVYDLPVTAPDSDTDGVPDCADECPDNPQQSRKHGKLGCCMCGVGMPPALALIGPLLLMRRACRCR